MSSFDVFTIFAKFSGKNRSLEKTGSSFVEKHLDGLLFSSTKQCILDKCQTLCVKMKAKYGEVPFVGLSTVHSARFPNEMTNFSESAFSVLVFSFLESALEPKVFGAVSWRCATPLFSVRTKWSKITGLMLLCSALNLRNLLCSVAKHSAAMRFLSPL